MLTADSRLTIDDIEALLAAAGTVPPFTVRPAWRVRVVGGGVEVAVTEGDASAFIDPEGRALHLSAGAAVFNLRLAMAIRGYAPRVTVTPRDRGGMLVARVTPGPIREPSLLERALYAVLVRGIDSSPATSGGSGSAGGGDGLAAYDGHPPGGPDGLAAYDGHPHGVAMSELRVGVGERLALQVAARTELSWLVFLDRPDTVAAVTAMVRKAENSLAVNHTRRSLLAAEIRAALERPGRSAGVLGVVGTTSDWPVDRVWAGQAIQRIRLTAASRRLTAVLMIHPFAVPAFPSTLRQRLGVGGAPQLLVRLGYGIPAQA